MNQEPLKKKFVLLFLHTLRLGYVTRITRLCVSLLAFLLHTGVVRITPL